VAGALGGKDDDGMLYKPKWRRWGTFNRYCERLDHHDSVIDAHERAGSTSMGLVVRRSATRVLPTDSA